VPSEAVNEMQQPLREEVPSSQEPASQGAKEAEPSPQKAQETKEATSH
jgi:hypothetical protein